VIPGDLEPRQTASQTAAAMFLGFFHGVGVVLFSNLFQVAEQCLTIRKGVQDFNEPNSVSAAQSAAQSHQVETVERVWLLILASVSPSL